MKLTIDLTEVDYSRTQPVNVDADLGIGELTVVIPDDIEYRITAEGDIGVVDVAGREETGIGNDATHESAGVSRGEVPDLVLHLDISIGEGSVVLR